MALQSNIFNLTKVRNGVDANSARLATNVETIYKFANSYTEDINNEGIIGYVLSPSNLIINVIDTSTGQGINISEATVEIILNDMVLSGMALKAMIGEVFYNKYVNKKLTETSDEGIETWYFHISQFYNDLYNGELDGISSEDLASLKKFFETDQPTNIEINLTLGTIPVPLYRSLPLQIGTNLDIATISIDAARGIFAAMQGAGLEFTSDGVRITNGNFVVTNNNNEAVLNFNKESQSLEITGTIYATGGRFAGELEAATGTFNGRITAATGNIGGFNITGHTIESDSLILSSAYDDKESYITVKNINIGKGAKISDYLDIGNLSLINPLSTYSYDNTVLKLTLPHDQLTQDQHPINQKNYYIKNGNEYELYTPLTVETYEQIEITEDQFNINKTNYYTKDNEDNYIQCDDSDVYDSQTQYYAKNVTYEFENLDQVEYYEDGNYFSLNDKGEIQGNNWSIKKESGNSYVTARFGKLIAEDGEFSGIIRATGGVFTGEVVSSIISASTINAVNFVTEKTRSMGGAFIFKPTFQIVEIEPLENEVIQFTLEGDISSYFPLEEQTSKIIAVSGFDTRFGEFFNLNEDKIQVRFKTGDYNILSNENALQNYQTVTYFGTPNEDILIGINSDNNSAGDILPPRAITMETFTELTEVGESGTGDIDKSIRLLLGDLDTLKINLGSEFNSIGGYGLYADNVFLHGSLTTASEGNNSYAGVNTQKEIPFNYTQWDGTSEQEIYSDDKIIFWGGSNSSESSDIQSSPFIVTDKGNIFARSGEFKGTVISDSVITQSIIKTPVIYGTDSGPSLRIYDTNSNKAGIGFYRLQGKIDKETDETDDVLTLTISDIGFTRNSKDFISFSENNSDVEFTGTKYTAGSTVFSSQKIQDGTSSDAPYIALADGTGINGIEIKYKTCGVKIDGTNVRNFGGQVINEGEMQIVSTTNSQKLNYKINTNGYYCLYVGN